ncbi:nuclear transcription factor Y subunit C-2-like [Andrographis paniculata]|uniref:nuclear transcription factor Y subunit C-2-like n=1 Tax=Andrographis paniculata TaxID=175694 RepID=UPI0021E964CA|nr:nuclear transcription factor Y subunit C-2-like [Andrographis paniculata]
MDLNQSMQHFTTSSYGQPTTQQMLSFMQMNTLGGGHENNPPKNFLNQLKENIEAFWKDQSTEISEASDMHTHSVSLARMKKIIKFDKEVKMVTADTPVIFAKACELFIMELTLRAWMRAQESNSETIHRNHVANAVRDEELLLFLKDIVPLAPNREEPAYAPISNPPSLMSVPFGHPGFQPEAYSMNAQAINQVFQDAAKLEILV